MVSLPYVHLGIYQSSVLCSSKLLSLETSINILTIELNSFWVFRPDVYDLALLDIKMPRMNGFELSKKLKGIDNKIIVCFLTAADLGYYRETDSDVINDLGTNCFIAKPINNED